MPRDTGTDFFGKMRNHKAFASIPIVVVSARSRRNLAVSKDVPVLDKPIDEQRLLQEVQSSLASTSAR